MTDKTTSRRIAELVLAGNGIGKTADTVTIDCENADAATELLDLLLRLADEEITLPEGDRMTQQTEDRLFLSNDRDTGTMVLTLRDKAGEHRLGRIAAGSQPRSFSWVLRYQHPETGLIKLDDGVAATSEIAAARQRHALSRAHPERFGLAPGYAEILRGTIARLEGAAAADPATTADAAAFRDLIGRETGDDHDLRHALLEMLYVELPQDDDLDGFVQQRGRRGVELLLEAAAARLGAPS